MRNQKMKVFKFKGKFAITITLLFLFFSAIDTNAQEAITTSGGEATGSGTSSYSVGQVVYTTNTGTGGSVTQGVQQPYEISVTTAIENTDDILLLFKVFPNPTTDVLILKVKNEKHESLTFQLFDMKGKLLKYGEIAGEETKINMSALTPSVYFVKIIEDNKELKTFKVIKK